MPETLKPVLDFINSLDAEEGTDDLADGAAALTRWLRTHKLIRAQDEASAADHRIAIGLRTGLRALALMNNGGDRDNHVLAEMQAALDRLPLVVSVDGGLDPQTVRAVPAALSNIVAGYASAVASGQWWRLRRCPAEDCAWAFWDSSPKGTRRWDVMRVCGNREKARNFAARRAASP